MAFKEAVDFYCNEMFNFCGADKPYVAKETLQLKHDHVYSQSMIVFEKSKKMGNREYHDIFIEKLQENLDKKFIEFKDNNEAKNIFKTFRFLIIFFTIFIVALILCETLELIGMGSFNLPFVLIGRLCFFFMAAWTYLRISGKARETMIVLNQTADAIWEIGQQAVYDNVFNYTLQTSPNKNPTRETIKIE